MITSELKNEVASFVANLVDEVVLNDSTSIKTFTSKSSEANIAVINFMIPENSGIINKITFKSNGKVLSESNVYLDAESEVQFSHRIGVDVYDR